MPVTINENVAYGLDTRLSVRPGYDNAAGMLGDISGVMSVFKRAISAARTAGGPYLDIPDNLAQTWQDSAGTIPATIGSTVGLLTDQTGLGNNATQATAGNRPVLTTHNGKPILSFNGTSNSMQLATNPIGPAGQPYTVIVAGVVGALGALRAMYGDSNRILRVYHDGSVGVAHALAGEARSAAALVSQGTPLVLEAWWDGTVARVALNGVQVGVNLALPGSTQTPGAAVIGQRGNSSEFFNGLLLPVFARGVVLPEAQRRQIARGMAQKLGVTYA